MTLRLPTLAALASACCFAAAAPSVAQTAPPKSDDRADSTFDKLWQLPTVYKDADSDVLNELRIVGRFHLDHYSLDSDSGDDSDFVIRRSRLGVKARLFEKLDAHIEADLDLEGERFFNRLTDANLAWTFSDAARLVVGKQSAKFTLDGATSSNDLLTIDRSNVANNFWFTNEYAPGITLGGKSGTWSYHGGLFSGGRTNRGFGDFDGGLFLIGSVGRDFGKALGVKRALVRADYVHNDHGPDSDFTRPYENIGTLALILNDENWGFSGEVTGADGASGQSDGFGITATPWIQLADKLQLVGRYTFLDSDKANGLRLARYDNVVTGGRGDRYHELYAGLNYLIYGNKLKLQTALSYADMRDRADDGGEHEGWTWTSGLRLSW